MTWRRLPGLDRRTRRRVLVAVGVGLTGELGALGLLTTGAWLLLSASLRPPILLLSIAIGAVQLFSFLRGTARYVERLASHNLGLGLQAGVRSWLYRRLELLLPAGLPGGDRGDLLARLIGDTEEAQDLVVRAAVPVLAAAGAWCADSWIACARCRRQTSQLWADPPRCNGHLGIGSKTSFGLTAGTTVPAPGGAGCCSRWHYRR